MIIDRFEGDFAVVEAENGRFYNIPKSLLPENAKEGCVIKIEIDKKATEKRKNEIKNKMDRLFRD